ncbi:MAG: hypothetical protein OSB21_03150, partial [Myxococcota bacterium]|nr:hypothetical protein [Myxococcota bacterium]
GLAGALGLAEALGLAGALGLAATFGSAEAVAASLGAAFLRVRRLGAAGTSALPAGEMVVSSDMDDPFLVANGTGTLRRHYRRWGNSAFNRSWERA